MAHDVQIKQLPAQLSLVVRTRATQETIGAAMEKAFGTLVRHAEATTPQFDGPPFALYPEMPDDEFAFAVCMPVAPGAVAGDDVALEEVPAVEAATLLYQGAYDDMESSWRRLLEWVGTSGRQPGGPLREIYLNDPDQVAEDELLTEMVVPLA